MGFLSSIGSFLSKTVEVVSDAASWVGEKIGQGLAFAREKAAQAMDWIADKGEQFIDSVKDVYKKVSPFLKQVRPWLDRVGSLVGIPFPWLKPAISAIGIAIDGLFTLENSPIAHALEKALRGVIKFARFSKDHYLSEEEVVEAKRYKKTFEQANSLNLNTQEQSAINLSILLNNYHIIKKELRDMLEEGVSDFQQYLRLRAVQKLLDMAEYKLTKTENIEHISKDDMFLIDIGEKMLTKAELLQDEAIRLDEIIGQRVGKKLIPFVFEELMVIWVEKQVNLEDEWNACKTEVAKMTATKKRLDSRKKVKQLSQDDQKTYDEIVAKLAGRQQKLKRLELENRSMENYVYAAEAFMQLLEKDEDELIKEDKSYLIEDTPKIANIIMKVASYNIAWNDLSDEERELLVDYATIYKIEGKERMQKIKKEQNIGVVEVEI